MNYVLQILIISFTVMICFHLQAMDLSFEGGMQRKLKQSIYSIELCRAASTGNIIGCCFLLEAGIHIESRDEKGRTALMCALEAGHGKIAILLISSGASLTVVDNEGKNVLTYAEDIAIQKIIMDQLRETNRKLSGIESALD